MIEGLINVVTPAGTPAAKRQPPSGAADETIDSVALAGAEAIQRIITDRNNLRSCTSCATARPGGLKLPSTKSCGDASA